MPHYYIDLRDGKERIPDDEGADYSSLEEALTEAKESARDIVQQYAKGQIPLRDTCVEVRDIEGRIIAALTVAEVLNHPIHPAFKNDCSDQPMPGHK